MLNPSFDVIIVYAFIITAWSGIKYNFFKLLVLILCQRDQERKELSTYKEGKHL